MTKKRKLHQLTGIIKYCWRGTSKSKSWKNQPFYYLEIVSRTLLGERSAVIYVFPNLVNKEIWKTLEKETYRDKQYLFIYEKRNRGWRLKEWQAINP